GPFLGLYAVGYLVVGCMSLTHYVKKFYQVKFAPVSALQEA
ncbi:MAG: hypothetical protein JWP91_3548, partial [Fibrobacteres bacterium]|nr:hypothetical protein [Fibrobacterota bacterium]